MTVSMRVMSAGDGYKYLLKTVVAADGDRPLSTPLTRYYMEDGTLPIVEPKVENSGLPQGQFWGAHVILGPCDLGKSFSQRA